MARWIGQAASAALVLSFSLHVLAVVVLAAIRISSGGLAGAGAGGAATAEVDYVLGPEVELASVFGSDGLELGTPPVGEIGSLDTPTGSFFDSPNSDLLGDIGGATPSGLTEGLGGSGGDVGGFEGLGSGGMGGGGTRFFGVEAQGSRFVYIVDVSGSMRGQRIIRLRQELIESINSLLDHMHFHVIFFSSSPFRMGNKTDWVRSTPQEKRWARTQIEAVQAEGGTEPWPAFDLVFSMRVLPDAIYFMTDGEFDPFVADQIATRNRGSRRIPVHCICFGDDAADETMRRIAADSGGTYTFIRDRQ